MSGTAPALRHLALAAAIVLTGCAEFYRWPDRMDRPPPSATRRPEPAAEGHYVVKPGDTLYSIAFRNQLDFRELAVWNDVGPDFLIVPGQVIRLDAPEVLEGGPVSMVGPASRTQAPLSRGPEPAAGAAPSASPPQRPLTPPVQVPLPAPTPEMPVVTQWRWPTRGSVVRPFGTGAKGVDIGGELGQPVLAAAGGKVVYSGAALKGYGELIIIKHDELHLSAYGYNRRRLVGEGAMVAAGQPIAELGLGPEQKPALHFEIRRKGKPVDPAAYLPAKP